MSPSGPQHQSLGGPFGHTLGMPITSETSAAIVLQTLCDFHARLGAPESLVTQGPRCWVPDSPSDHRCLLPPRTQGGRHSHLSSEISPRALRAPFSLAFPLLWFYICLQESFHQIPQAGSKKLLQREGSRSSERYRRTNTSEYFNTLAGLGCQSVQKRLMSSLESSRRRGSWKDGSRGHTQGLARVERETSSEGTRQSLHAAASPWHPAHQGSCASRSHRSPWSIQGLGLAGSQARRREGTQEPLLLSAVGLGDLETANTAV